MNRPTMGKVFWTAFGLSEAVLLYLLVMTLRSGSPWADLGVIALLMPLGFVGVAAGVFATAKSENARLLCLLAVIVLLLCAGVPALTVLTEQTRERAEGPVDPLAIALRMGNVEGVRQLAPGAVDVNRFYAEASRFLAGPEGDGMRRQEMLEAILAAGADANYAEGEQAPAWWAWIHRDGHRVEDVEIVRLLLARGVDVKKRVRGEGPVAVAVRRECWQTAVVLLEAGAEWQGESAKGVRYAVEQLGYGRQAVPEALGNLKVMIEESR
jgi:hypothetical protein